MTLFDAYLFIDWSAANVVSPQSPTANSVWVGELESHSGFKNETYFRTRNAAYEHLLAVVLSHANEERKILIGFDFPYGYPAGFAKALGLSDDNPSWWAIWSELASRIKDNVRNKSNRFIVAGELNAMIGSDKLGPFYGCPVGYETPVLQRSSPGFPFPARDDEKLEKLRIVEKRLSGVQETWKLYGVGSVGSQALVGIPYVYKLRQHPKLANMSRVWPFETQFTSKPSPKQGPFILHAEIWPGVVKERVASLQLRNPEMINDCAQVRAMCEWALECDQNGTFGQLFESPNKLSRRQVKICTEQEGWILGAT